MPLTTDVRQIKASLGNRGKAMANEMQHCGERRGIPLRLIGWGMVALVLLLPLVAMQLTREIHWTLGDFVFLGLLFGFVGLALELTVRVTRNPAHRAAVATALAAALLTIWVNGAVGMIGAEENPYNLFFFGVIVVALLGSVVARFRPAGMAVAMLVAAIAQFIAGAAGTFTDVRGGILSALFAVLWLLSAMLFAKAAREPESAGTAA